MSETDNVETTEDQTKPASTTETVKRTVLLEAEVDAAIDGIMQYKKTSFLVVGHKGGTRLAIPLTKDVGRVYYYGDDYAALPKHEAITVFTVEERKARRLGGIMAEVDFSRGHDLALEAFTALTQVVRAAKEPVPRSVKVKTPRAPKPVKVKAVPAGESKQADQLDANDDLGAPPDDGADEYADNGAE